MKKKSLSVMSLAIVSSMMMASLTGCGTTAKATDITIEDGDTIIVEEEEVEADTEVETESESDEITETEVIGGDGKATDSTEFAGAEDENIVLYAEIEEQRQFLDIYNFNYVENTGTVSATEDIPIYNGDGFNVGYIKNGASVVIEESADGVTWSRFTNPIAGTDYDYLYVMNDYITVPMFTITESDLKQKIIDEIKGFEVTEYTFVDAPSSDMEVFEFRIESEFEDELDFEYWYDQCTDTDNSVLSKYMTYCIESEKDTDGWISCKVYYKDEIPEDVWNQYYYGY